MSEEIHAPPNTILRIDQLWLFVSEDETGEGVCGAPLLGPGSTVPLIAADVARLDSLRKWAAAIATASGKKVKLVRFSVREDIEEILP